MYILEKISQHRRDFRAFYKCEFCGNIIDEYGYDDSNFHKNVIPKMKCKKCGKSSGKPYKKMGTKYSDNKII